LKREAQQYHSPGRQVWYNLVANKVSLLGLVIIVFFLLVAILGPFIRPDASSKANDQYLELSRKKPGFSIGFFCLNSNQKQKEGVFQRWLWGSAPQECYPFYTYELRSNEIILEKYTGNTPNDGEKVFFKKEQLPALEEWTEEAIQKRYIKTRTFLLGTDRYGRDMLSRLMAGTWISFSVGFISIAISLFIGITLGALAGYYRGKWDDIIMWFINVVWSIPTLLLVIAITLALGKGFWQVFIAVGLTMWVEVARVVRGQVISIREKEFVEAGKALGFFNRRVILRHILPNITGPVIVISASNFAAAILIEAGLSFLGLGAQPPQATWGKMISEHKGYIITGDAYLAIFPGIAIFLLVLSFVLVGNGLRDAFDVKGVKSNNL
jgi:peptide/nickel transport system permease protein